MSDLRDTAQRALKALSLALSDVEWRVDSPTQRSINNAYNSLRAALAQEAKPAIPYAWMAVGGTIWRHKTREDDVPLYTAPPQRKPLTDEQIRDGRDQLPTEDLCGWSFRAGVAFAERSHGIGGDAP